MDDDDAASASSADAYVPFNVLEMLKDQWRQHPAFRPYVSAGSFPPDIDDGDRQFLANGKAWARLRINSTGQTTRPNNPFYDPSDLRWTFASYVPYWAKPNQDLRRQERYTLATGPVYRYVDHSAFKSWRPANFPVDQSKRPTPYAVSDPGALL